MSRTWLRRLALGVLLAACLTTPALGGLFTPQAVRILGAGQRDVAFGQAVHLVAHLSPPWALGQVTWTSSLEGPLGRGRFVRLTALRPGVHVIRATLPSGLEERVVLHVDGWGDRGPFEAVLPLAREAVAARRAGPPRLDDPDAFRHALRQAPSFVLGPRPRLGMPSFDELLDAHATPMHAALGHGDLTAGVDDEGTLTLLRWPGPAGLDHLDVTGTDRKLPRAGIRADQGLFVGLRWTDAAGAQHVGWLRDAPWTVASCAYAGDEADTLVTVYRNPQAGLEVVQIDAVDPDAPVLGRRLEVRTLPGSPAVAARLLVYGNPAPCTRRIPYLPLTDNALDLLNGYLTVYDAADDLVLAHRPNAPDPRELRAVVEAGLASGAAAAATAAGVLARDLDLLQGPGVSLACGGSDPSDAVQVGAAGAAPGSARAASDPLRDAADGDLAGETFATGRGAFVLARDLRLTGGPAAWTVFVAAGPQADGPDGARTLLRQARARGFAALRQASEARWQAWLARATLPNLPPSLQGGRARAVILRSLISARTAFDPRSGAIVASVANQLPYYLDWPRDGAFINTALDLAGYGDMVEAHNAFYLRVQRSSGLLAGSYDMNYGPDGTPGGPVFLELDNAGCAAWALADHARFIPDPARRAAYLRRVLPGIARTADFLVRWRDPVSGLPLPANEDDHPELTQGLQGASSAVAALEAAVDAGRAVGWDPAALQRWERRRLELEGAIQRRFRRSDRLGDPTSSTYVRSMAWTVWPAGLLEGDPLLPLHGDALLGVQAGFLARRPRRYLYNAETLHAVARARPNDPATRARVARGLRILLEEVPTPGTNHYAEAYEAVAVPGGGVRWENVNDAPHVWEHTLVYLLARELYGP